MAEPQYSNTQPVPPPTPILAMSARMMSLAVTPAPQSAVHDAPGRSSAPLQQALRGQHVLDLAGADAESQRAEGAVRGRVAVAADDRHAGLGEPSSGPITCTMPWRRCESRSRGCRTRRSWPPAAQPARRRPDRDGQRARGGRGTCCGRRWPGQVRAPHFQAARPQPVEGLRRGHLVDQMQVDIEECGRAGLLPSPRGRPRSFR
jgi:hypothetical protein